VSFTAHIPQLSTCLTDKRASLMTCIAAGTVKRTGHAPSSCGDWCHRAAGLKVPGAHRGGAGRRCLARATGLKEPVPPDLGVGAAAGREALAPAWRRLGGEGEAAHQRERGATTGGRGVVWAGAGAEEGWTDVGLATRRCAVGGRARDREMRHRGLLERTGQGARLADAPPRLNGRDGGPEGLTVCSKINCIG
jgi:hypothetical protein